LSLRHKLDFVVAGLLILAITMAAIVLLERKVKAQAIERPRPEFGAWAVDARVNGSTFVYTLKHHKTQTCWLVVEYSSIQRGGVSIIEAPKEVCQ
jgi:hypothetical protein